MIGFYIALTILIVCIFTLIISTNKGLDTLSFISGFIGAISLTGTIMTSIILNNEVRYDPVVVEVTKNTRLVLVDDGNKTWTFTSHTAYKAISDTSQFYHYVTTNIWGFERLVKIVYDIDEDKLTK